MTPVSRSGPVVKNQSRVLYSSAAGTDAIAFSNTVNTSVVSPVLSVFKTASAISVSLGDTLVYKISVRNNGNVAGEATLIDPLPQGVSFIANSVLRDGVPLPGVTPSSGIPLGPIAPGTQVNISFQVIVVSLPASLELQNQATARYAFVTPEGREVQGEVSSNVSKVSLAAYLLSSFLSANTNTTFVGDVITYTLQLRNEGARTLSGLLARIPLPEGAAFIPGSVIVGNMYVPGDDPAIGIPLGALVPGASLSISFRARVTLAPPSPVLGTKAVTSYGEGDEKYATTSNLAEINVVSPGFTIRLRTDLTKAVPGDNLRYEFNVINDGNLAVDAILIDAIPSGTLFVWDSITVNGVPRKGIRPGDGIPLGTIRAGERVIVRFLVSIPAFTDIRTLPAISNQGSIQYTFLLPDGRNVRQSESSNLVMTQLFSPVITVEIANDPPIVETGGIVGFRITVHNSGNTPAEVSVIRIIPPATILDPDLVYVSTLGSHGVPYSGAVQLGTLAPGESATISYYVKVNVDYLGHIITGYCNALYTFALDTRKYSGEARSNSYQIQIEEFSE
ncbi:DUF11 domain-containing protein [Paenibacillus sp. NFR01]|uniref:DUF11 domain-containing protein n=1 Tax=Paenibacillus sp. NFR01 TaxID=1566279 RepID=UPI0008BCE407|nr:DUF11 domain-containing protein [Paenibacillus sp. NFR01]SES91006.1 conserved repeat domain-containing protein [Paenibacillus sp. NFR01]